jgi:hypothetical protein
MKNNLIILFVLFNSTMLFAQNDWQTLEKDNFAISYPKDWVSSDQKPQPTIAILLLSDEESQKTDQFRENINLNLEDLKGQTLSLDEYAKISIDQIKNQIPNAEILSNGTTKINGWEAKSVVWHADFGNNMTLKFKQVFLLNNGIAYVLTYSSTKTEYDDYFEVADKIINSFNFAK